MRLLLISCLLLAAAGSASAAACEYLSNKYELNVFENTPIGTLIQVLVKTTEMASDTFSIVDQTPSPFPFKEIIAENVTLNITGKIDRETNFAYTCALRCVSKKSSSAGERKVLILISILDVDDTSPVWASPGYYQGKVNEGAGVGTEVAFVGQRPQISDADSSASQRLEVRIVPGPYSNVIKLKSFVTTTPTILTNKIFDYEEKSSYDIELIFMDYDAKSGKLVFNGTTNLTLTVNDLEDEPPKWEHQKYTTVVDSNPVKGRLLSFQPAELKAYDGDTAINATILYSLPNGVITIVDVNKTTAQLSLNADNPKPTVYQTYIKAYEEERPTRSSLVLVQIDVKSSTVHPLCRAPVVKLSLPEDTPNNTKVVDTDINYPLNSADLTYTLLTHTTVFYISGGWLILLQKLDYEKRSEPYNVTVNVTDGIKPAVCIFEITPTNVNDNSPVFEKTTYDFKPTSRGKGITVGTAKAEDADKDSVIYSLKQTDLFSVDSTKGVIKLNASSELYVKDSYSFLVVANDNISPNPREGQALVRVVFATTNVAAANSLVVAMATLGALLVMVLVVAAIVFFLYRKRYQKHLPVSATPNKEDNNRYFYENHATADQAEAAWTNVPSPLEAMYKESYTKEADAASEPDANDCVNCGTEYGPNQGSIRSVSGMSNTTSAACRRMALAMENRPSPAELSEVEGSIESYSIDHERTPPQGTDNMVHL